MRELPVATANPGDARVKVGSERQAASSPHGPNVAVIEIGYTTIANLSAGTLQNWRFHKEVYSEKAPRRYVGKAGLECKPPRWYACKSQLCLQSDAQLFSTIAHRSLVFLGAIFVLGHPKPSRNRPETARHSGVPGCVQILLTMELKDNSKCRVPRCIQLRPGPGLKIDTF